MFTRLQNASKSFGSFAILSDVSFQIEPGEKIGLIGANGAGKTTLLRLISGSEAPDSGDVFKRTALKIGTLAQIPDFHDGGTVLEEALRAFESLRALEFELRHLETLIAERTSKELLDRYSRLQTEFEHRGGYSYRARAEAALLGVGFPPDGFGWSSNALSGGEKNRLALAKLLLSDSDLLLLDEPTNHLDIQAIEWLEGFLRDTDKTLLLISHDRFFLDRVVSRILELQFGRLHDYRGNYSSYLKERAARLALQQKEYEFQQQWVEKTQEFIRRNMAGQKTKQAQSRLNLLNRTKLIEKPRSSSARVHFRFTPAEKGGRYVLAAKDLIVGYAGKPLIRNLNLSVERRDRWAILGPNGSGKTTLLKTLIGSLPPLEGDLEWNERLHFGYYDQQLQDLDPAGTVIGGIRSLDSQPTDGELRSYLGQFLFTGDDVFKRVSQLSGGEKSRLMLARIIYLQPHLLALDEPTNHLDIDSREALETALAEFPGTILFITHDRYLTEKIATHILYLDRSGALAFDRYGAFEDWLSRPVESTPVSPPAPAALPKKEASGLSKNRRDQILKQIADLEMRIEAVEREIACVESSFRSPAADTDWAELNRKYSELQSGRELMYGQLDELWKVLEN